MPKLNSRKKKWPKRVGALGPRTRYDGRTKRPDDCQRPTNLRSRDPRVRCLWDDVLGHFLTSTPSTGPLTVRNSRGSAPRSRASSWTGSGGCDRSDAQHRTGLEEADLLRRWCATSPATMRGRSGTSAIDVITNASVVGLSSGRSSMVYGFDCRNAVRSPSSSVINSSARSIRESGPSKEGCSDIVPRIPFAGAHLSAGPRGKRRPLGLQHRASPCAHMDKRRTVDVGTGISLRSLRVCFQPRPPKSCRPWLGDSRTSLPPRKSTCRNHNMLRSTVVDNSAIRLRAPTLGSHRSPYNQLLDRLSRAPTRPRSATPLPDLLAIGLPAVLRRSPSMQPPSPRTLVGQWSKRSGAYC